LTIDIFSLHFTLDGFGGPNVFLAVVADEVASGLDLILFLVVLCLALGLHVWEVAWREFNIEVTAWEILVEENSASWSLGTNASKGDESGDLHTEKNC